MEAARAGNLGCVKVLVDAGASLIAKDVSGYVYMRTMVWLRRLWYLLKLMLIHRLAAGWQHSRASGADGRAC